MLLSLLLTLFAAVSTPTISTPDKGDTFKVTFDRGAVWSCVVFRMVKPTEKDKTLWPDGHYAPRSCGPVDVHDTTFTEPWNPYIHDPQTGKPYNVEWDVYVEVQYPGPNNTFPAVESNRVRVTK